MLFMFIKRDNRSRHRDNSDDEDNDDEDVITFDYIQITNSNSYYLHELQLIQFEYMHEQNVSIERNIK